MGSPRACLALAFAGFLPARCISTKPFRFRVNHANMVGLEPSESYVLVFELANSRGPGFIPIGPTLYSEHSDTVYGLFPTWIESISSRALSTFTTPRSTYSLLLNAPLLPSIPSFILRTFGVVIEVPIIWSLQGCLFSSLSSCLVPASQRRPAGARAFCISHVSRSAKTNNCCLAVLYQAIDAPVFNDVRKPKKPGDLLSTRSRTESSPLSPCVGS